MDLRHEIDEKYNSMSRHKIRWEKTFLWLVERSADIYKSWGRCLDIGDGTPFTNTLYSLSASITIIENTAFDLDYAREYHYPNDHFGNIFCFEVIEHLMNAGSFMQWCHRILKDQGSMFMSTPIRRPRWMRNKTDHFHEFNLNELYYLIKNSGFKIVDEKVINSNPLRHIFTGVRPFLRYIYFDRTILLELKKENQS
jgi:SAM-dependent methyltransferase